MAVWISSKDGPILACIASTTKHLLVVFLAILRRQKQMESALHQSMMMVGPH